MAATLLLPVSRVDAHALLVSSNPPNGARLDDAPSAVTVTFNEPVAADFTPLVVRDRAGVRVDAGDARVDPRDPTLVSVSLKPLPSGFYTVVYRVTSLDGHPVQGTLSFTVGKVLAPAPTPAEPAPTVPVGAGVVHGGMQMLAIILAGLTGFLVLVWWPVAGMEKPPGLGRRATLLTLLFVLLGCAEVGIYAVRASGEAFSLALFGQALFRTRVGQLWVFRGGLATLAGVSLAWAHRLRAGLMRGLALLPGAVLLLTLSLQSHAMATRELLPVVADWAHLLAAAPWVGGLVGFALITWPALRDRSVTEREGLLVQVIPRFSRVAVSSVLLLTGTGVYAARLHIPSWEALVSTAYGRSLLVKLAFLVPVLGLGGYNFIRKGRGPFRRAVWCEVALMLGIFVAAGFLTSLPPAKIEMATRQGPYEQKVSQEGLAIALRIDPNRVGSNQPVITLTRADGTPEQGASVGLRVTMTAHDMGLQNLNASEESTGIYRGEPIIFGMDGQWQVEVVILTKEGREIRRPFRVTVPPPLTP